MSVAEAALRFSLSHPNVTSAIVGYSEARHIDEALQSFDKGAIPREMIEELLALIWEQETENR